MSDQPRILAFAGSARTDSFNVKLVNIAAEGAREAGAEVTVVNLKDFPMPLFNQDLEAADGPPDHATRLKGIMLAHDGLLIASPEYNSSISPLLKNTIDWVVADTDLLSIRSSGAFARTLAPMTDAERRNSEYISYGFVLFPMLLVVLIPRFRRRMVKPIEIKDEVKS